MTTAGAQWIGTSAGAGNGSRGYTALFAIGFTIPDPFAAATLTLSSEVDNEIGDLSPGIYLNGIALPFSTGIPSASTNSFSALRTYSDSSVDSDLVQGTNWLYVDTVNVGSEAEAKVSR